MEFGLWLYEIFCHCRRFLLSFLFNLQVHKLTKVEDTEVIVVKSKFKKNRNPKENARTTLIKSHRTNKYRQTRKAHAF